MSSQRSRRFAPLGIIFGLLGLLLFVYFVRKAGLSDVIAGIRRLGYGFLLILAISSIRHTVRSIAWIACVESPYKLRFIDALAARLIGDALGNLIPLAGVAVSEPSKAVFVRERLPLVIAFSGLAIENIFYSLSVAVFIFSGVATLLLNYSLPKSLNYASLGTLVVTLLVIPLVVFLISREFRFISGALRFLESHRIAPVWSARNLPAAESLEARIYGFYRRRRKAFIAILALEFAFHMAGVLEIYTTLSFVSPVRPSFIAAFILESVNRVINVAFKFIPLRTGIDEAGTGMLSKVLGFTTATGVTLAIIRKGRDIFWSAIGILLLLHKGLPLRESLNAPTTQLENVPLTDD